MRANNKECPRCAETIKAAASVCKHCGYEFSEADVAASKRRGEFAEVDRLIRDTTYGKFITKDGCQDVAQEAGMSPSAVRARAIEIGLKYDDGTEESAQKRRLSMEAEAAELTEQGPLTPSVLKHLADEYGFTERSAKATLLRAGLRFDHSALDDIDEIDEPAETIGGELTAWVR